MVKQLQGRKYGRVMSVLHILPAPEPSYLHESSSKNRYDISRKDAKFVAATDLTDLFRYNGHGKNSELVAVAVGATLDHLNFPVVKEYVSLRDSENILNCSPLTQHPKSGSFALSCGLRIRAVRR